MSEERAKALLRTLQPLEQPPPEVAERMLARLHQSVQPSAAPVAASTKGLSVVAGLVTRALVIGAFILSGPRSEPALVGAPVEAAAESPSFQRTVLVMPRVQAKEPVAPAALPAEPPAPPASSEDDLLLVEQRLLMSAKTALGRKDVASASTALAAYAAQVGEGGQLTQERDALVIEVAFARGDHAAAKALVRRFLDKHPTSPLRARLQAIGVEE